jgi:hypothetical protein
MAGGRFVGGRHQFFIPVDANEALLFQRKIQMNLTPLEIQVARCAGSDPEAVAAQKGGRGIFGKSLHTASGPFTAANFPLKWHAPLRDGRPHPDDSLPGWPIQPTAEATSAPDSDDDDDDIDDQAADPVGLRRKKMGVVFPNGKRI